MPELPEVEAARRAVHEHCGGKRIIKAMIADDPKVIDGIAPSELEKGIVGKKIIAAHRKGKNMWLQLDSPPFPSFQFGMTGAVYIKGVSVTKYKRSAINDKDEWPSKFSKVFVELDDGTEMSFTDKRRFARVRLLENPEMVPPISELGPDALLDLMPEDVFINALSKREIAIKSLLLDQGFIAGIGNWVADEVLYQARIHPLQSSSKISKENCKSLRKCIEEVIEKALEVGADSSQYPENWIFHSREKKLAKAFVDGKEIEFITVGGRTSAYVPDLQKVDGPAPGNQPDKKGGNRSRKKSDVIKSENLQSAQEISDDNEGEDEKGQGKREGKPSKTSKAGTARSSGSGMGGKSKRKATTLKENPESKQESEKEEKLNHIMKNIGKGQDSAKTEMIETASSGKKRKNKRTIAAEVEKLKKNKATKNVNEFDMPDQTNNPDASAKESSENTSQAQKRKRGPKSK
ncbi:formamidopyrimidine-DNA glycosylase isoform X1 [Cryptomeria japonica]|uniref:formamidopyrimidine-DNA glycosylase isoform X1 n=1 Tax=Cryptomeria japonica TaxID=3369 RepID=UPI0025ABD03B|nr:formamidopyrimidine-DNA glycosylase isoform X1 [Cryptomeria japonica]XP_057843231.1 formamidopyrimidine-DNA glycosylase isoform X1 [Cryptomeria japonica]